jgi:hypothetical protein
MTRATRTACLLIAPLVCLAFFWRVPLTWFVNDDFAWLGLPLEVHRAGDLLPVIFQPKAQGTIRFLSERLFFLTFSSLFGLNAVPYRIMVLATWFGTLTLATLIGARLTGSRAAGILAAVLWTINSNITAPLAWASAYNEVLCGFLLLAAFYSRLRWYDTGRAVWMVLEWSAYLLGFGAKESIVMYPAIAALHALCTSRKRIWSTLPLFVPAAVFMVLHFFFIPKNAGDYYKIVVDSRLPGNFLQYLKWTAGPSHLGDWIGHGRRWGLIATELIGAALLMFTLWRVRRRDYAALFCVGWFVLMIAPVLPLPNHITDFYVTVPAVGLAWLGGWAIVAGWRSGIATRVIAIVLAAAYVVGAAFEVNAYTRWYYERAQRIKTVVLGVKEVSHAHPGASILLEGVDNDIFQAGFQDDPFRLFGLQKIYFVPGGDKGIQARADLGGTTRFLISPNQALDQIEHGRAFVLQVSNGEVKDITRMYQTVLRADPRATQQDFVDVGDPNYASLVGPTWYPPEQGFRWMPKIATVKLSNPLTEGLKLHVSGYAPAAVLAAGPVTLRFSTQMIEIGSATIKKADEPFSLEFPMPATLVGQGTFELTIEANKAMHPPGDPRDLAMVFGTFSIR